MHNPTELDPRVYNGLQNIFSVVYKYFQVVVYCFKINTLIRSNNWRVLDFTGCKSASRTLYFHCHLGLLPFPEQGAHTAAMDASRSLQPQQGAPLCLYWRQAGSRAEPAAPLGPPPCTPLHWQPVGSAGTQQHPVSVWWQRCQRHWHHFYMDLHLHTEEKQEQLRHKWHVYTWKQQEPVTDEQTAFKPALLIVVLAVKIFKRCLFSLTLTSQLLNPTWILSHV